MTVETRHLVELKDIGAVEFECRNCHDKIVRKLEGFNQPPVACGNCGTQLMIPNSQSYGQLVQFLRTMESLSAMNGERFSLRLELKASAVPKAGIVTHGV